MKGGTEQKLQDNEVVTYHVVDVEYTPTPLAGHLSDLRPRRRDFLGLGVETSWALPHACNTVPKSGALYAYST